MSMPSISGLADPAACNARHDVEQRCARWPSSIALYFPQSGQVSMIVDVEDGSAR
jgi:hypothetical protein